MSDEREYITILDILYRKSLILHDTTLFHPVLYFYLIDAIAHIDYTVGLMAYNYTSPKNIMAGEYLRWRIDEERKGDRALFGKFINWLREIHPDRFDTLPMLWKRIYDDEDQASYRSFRIVIDPDQSTPLPPGFFFRAIEEFFNQEFLKSLYSDASLGKLFEEFRHESTARM
ncbi:MAG TPA: hypothetical protein VMS89_08880 [Methanoregulaceae archaeon]|nr:hypothetical protein [Methanoregulaceae archaeon]